MKQENQEVARLYGELAKHALQIHYIYAKLASILSSSSASDLSDMNRYPCIMPYAYKQLQSQQNSEVHYHIDHVDTLNLGDNVENKFS